MTDLNKEKEFEQEAAAAEEAQAAEETAEAAEAQCEEECTDACDEEECAEAEDAEGSEEPKTWAEKKAAKKAAKQNKQEEAYKEQIAQLEDRVMRQMAEFENFRKRTDREKQTMFEMGAKSVIEKILPVVDNFERGFATVDPADENDAFVGGMRMVYKQLMTELENMGVKPIEAVGQEFDPNLHNAVMQMESDEYESGFVAQELLKGYTYHDTVVRYSMVAVVP
jgi:molecular chaperone GrpE